MSDTKNKVGLKATKISFTEFSIVYDIEFDKEVKVIGSTPVVCSPKDIVDKDLILKPTLIQPDFMKVVYTPSNMTPHYFQDLLSKKLRNYEEHCVDVKNYYNVGDIVGYIFV